MNRVAIAWQVYELSDSPTALSIVFASWAASTLAFLLLGGIAADRFERRRVLVASDIIRGISIGTIGLLSVAGLLQLWHLVVLICVYGAGTAFFGPAFGAIVPEVVPEEELVEANSLEQSVNPLASRLIGPAIGGGIIGMLGVGTAFLLDAATFGVSAVAIQSMESRFVSRKERADSSLKREMAAAWHFVRSDSFLTVTMVMGGIGMLAFAGPVGVLVPFIVKHHLGGGGSDMGLVIAAGGAGAILTSVLMGQRGLPRRYVLSMYGAWAAALFLVASYALVTDIWQALVISLIFGGFIAIGEILWVTTLQKLVPTVFLGRVTSFASVMSLCLTPVSFALVGPVAEAAGAGATLLAVGSLGGAVTLLFLLSPSVRNARTGSATGTTGQAYPLSLQRRGSINREQPAL